MRSEGRIAMTKSAYRSAALGLILALALPWPQAFATTTSQALSICISRGTDCSVTNKGGGHEICVNNTGGKQCVNCPALTAKDQTCSVAAKKAGGKKDIAGVEAILKKTSK
jgi:hypothetical protein